MRNFPAQVGPGGEPISDNASWTSSNANDALQEAQNSITDSGQTLIPVANPPDNTQLSEAMSRNAATATFYADSGTANAYVLSTLGSFKAPAVYLDGQIIRWVADNANTGASTVNVAGVGVKDLTLQGGTALSGGEIDTSRENQARFNLSSDRFELTSIAAIDNIIFTEFFESSQQTVTSAGALTIAHGLSSEPTLFQMHLVVITAEDGYAIGDKIPIAPNNVGGATTQGVAIKDSDATNIFLRYASTADVFTVLDGGSGIFRTFTNANIRLVVRVWA